MEALGAQVIDYSTWYDCCGFGFRHIISEREFTRSFAIDRKIKVAVEEARRRDDRPRHRLHHHAGQEPVDRQGGRQGLQPADHGRLQFAALACGAHPFKIVQSHWHASPTRPDGEDGHRLGCGEEEFEAYLEGGRGRASRPVRPAITSPGYGNRAQASWSGGHGIDRRRRTGRAVRGACAGQPPASKAVMVEKEDRLGGAPILSGYAKLVPSGEWAKDAIGGMVERVEDDPNGRGRTRAQVASFEGEAGQFHRTLSHGETVEPGAAILAPASPTSTRPTSPSGASAPIPTW
jgi:hypothetical protein